jgi:NADH:ubiquinone oxidoreductase subunit 3 (subunit A)
MNMLLMLFVFVPILILILLTINYLLAPSKPDAEKLSIYECGFSSVYGQTRSTFHINFYLVAMFFLVFDLEVMLLFPLTLSFYQVGIYGFTIAIIFFIVLTIGFILEIASGALKLNTNKSVSIQSKEL